MNICQIKTAGLTAKADLALVFHLGSTILTIVVVHGKFVCSLFIFVYLTMQNFLKILILYDTLFRAAANSQCGSTCPGGLSSEVQISIDCVVPLK